MTTTLMEKSARHVDEETQGQRQYRWFKIVLGCIGVPLKMGTATIITIVAVAWSIFAYHVLYRPILTLASFVYVMVPSRASIARRLCRRVATDDTLRRILIWPVRICARLILYCLGFFWITTNGHPALYTEAPIIVCNHLSIWESMYLFWRYGAFTVNRSENLSIPGLAAVLQLTGAIFVDRRNAASCRSASQAIKSRMLLFEQKRNEDVQSSLSQMLIFPEGDTTQGDRVSLAEFKTGAFRPHVPVQPVVVRMPWKYHNPAWTDHTSIFGLLVDMYRQFFNRMHVEFLPVYTPTGRELQEDDLFTRNVRETIRLHLPECTRLP